MTNEQLSEILKKEFPKVSFDRESWHDITLNIFRKGEHKITVYVALARYGDYEGKDLFHHSHDKKLSGYSYASPNIEYVLDRLREQIKSISPKLLEDEQLTLF
jgi:hypothetical protein